MPHLNNMSYYDPNSMSLSATPGNGGGYYDHAAGSGPGRVSAYSNTDPFAVGSALTMGGGADGSVGGGHSNGAYLPAAILGSTGSGRSRINGGSTSTASVASAGSAPVVARNRSSGRTSLPVQRPRPTGSAWNPQDDALLLQLRRENHNWNKIHTRFAGKTPNACRKRHERLQERLHHDEFDDERMRRIARSYVRMRQEIWKPLAQAAGEKWAVVEAKCMSSGLKTLQGIARTADHRERLGVGYVGGSGGVGSGSDSGSAVTGEAAAMGGLAGAGVLALAGMHDGLISVYNKDDDDDDGGDDNDDKTSAGDGVGGLPVVAGHNGLHHHHHHPHHHFGQHLSSSSSPRGSGRAYREEPEGPGSSPSSGSAGGSNNSNSRSNSSSRSSHHVRHRSSVAGGHRSVSSVSSTASMALQSHMLPPPPQPHSSSSSNHFHHQQYAAAAQQVVSVNTPSPPPGSGSGSSNSVGSNSGGNSGSGTNGYDFYATPAGFSHTLRHLGEQQQQQQHQGMSPAAAAAAVAMVNNHYSPMGSGGHSGQ